MVNVNVPAAPGVPVMAPLLARERPVGSLGFVTVNATGAMPPVLVMLALYGEPAVPPGRVLVVIASGLAT